MVTVVEVFVVNSTEQLLYYKCRIVISLVCILGYLPSVALDLRTLTKKTRKLGSTSSESSNQQAIMVISKCVHVHVVRWTHSIGRSESQIGDLPNVWGSSLSTMKILGEPT